jgi:nicotinamidase-related amidase
MKVVTFNVLALVCFCANSAFAADAVAEWNSIEALPPPELHTVTLDPATTGLMVMDFGTQFCLPDQRPRCAESIPAVKRVVDAARAANITMVYIRSGTMQPEDFIAEIAPGPGDHYFQGIKEDKMIGNDTEQVFRNAGVDTLVLVGTQGSGSVLITAIGAALRGFKVVVPVDTMPSATAYQEQFTIWEIANGRVFRDLSTLTRSDMLRFGN